MDDFLIRALVGGIGVAVVSGPLGCLVIWQRMSYFGAALSHAALLGIALGLLFEINLTLAILFIACGVSVLLLLMEKLRLLTSDTALGILAHTTLALGLVVLTLMPTVRTDLFAYLFGDILTITWTDILWIYVGGISVIILLINIWRPLLSLTVQRELALVDGANESRVRFIFLILLSIVVAVSMQVVGILLIVSLLIIPAAAARRLSRSPEQMALLASVIGSVAIFLGLLLSLTWDTPAGPSIVLVASSLFILSLPVALLFQSE